MPPNHHQFQDSCSPLLLSNNSLSDLWHFRPWFQEDPLHSYGGAKAHEDLLKVTWMRLGVIFLSSPLFAFVCSCIFLCFFTLKYSSKKSLSQGPLMPGRVRWYKVESGCNGLAWPGCSLEAKLTSKAKGPVPLFCVFADCFPVVVPNIQGEQALV